MFNHRLLRLEFSARRALGLPRVVRLRPRVKPAGHVLLSYLTGPFIRPHAANHFSNRWECRQMAQTFLDLGMAVDVIDWYDKRFVPRQEYRFLVDIGCNMPRLAPLVGKDCVKLMHATGKHWLFQNRAELQRLTDLHRRRGVALEPRRQVPTGCAAELADCITVLGNQMTADTFQYTGKPVYRIPLSSAAEFPWDETKDFRRARRRFLWLGSGGMVHKGLDLVLEAFAGMPELELVVCGPVGGEEDFQRHYHRELYETPNIHTRGWVDVTTPEFAAVTRDVAAMVYPSCSEGSAGCVIVGLHAGLIPIVSRETGVDVDHFGVEMPHSTIDEIRRAARSLSGRSADELRQRSRAAWQRAREYFSRERFAEAFRNVVMEWLTPATPAAGALPLTLNDRGSLDVADMNFRVRDERFPFDVGGTGDGAQHLENLQAAADLSERLL
jgi:glycosyltransferase involved in cell wall biosynthesis